MTCTDWGVEMCVRASLIVWIVSRYVNVSLNKLRKGGEMTNLDV